MPRKIKKNQFPGISSDPTKEALKLFTLMCRSDQVDFILQELTNYSKDTTGVGIRNFNKVINAIRRWASLKDKELPISQSQETKEETKPEIHVPTPVIPQKEKLSVFKRLLTKPVGLPVLTEEPKFKVVEPPHGRGAAPSTEISLVPVEKEKKVTKTKTDTSDPNARIKKAAQNYLSKYKLLPLDKSWPYIKVASISNPDGSESKFVVLGTASGYNNEKYYKIYCAVNGKVPSKKNVDNLFKGANNETFTYNSIVPIPTKSFSDERWIRLIEYQDGMLFRYWKHNKITNKDEDQKYFQLVGNTLTELTASTFQMLEKAKIL